MFSLIVQTILLIAIAFILGCILGCLLRRLFGAAETVAPAAAGVSAVAATAAVAKPTPPVVPKPPVPQAPVKPVEPVQPVAAPVVAKPKPQPKPKPKVAKPAPVKTTPKKPDNLKLIRGIGPQNEGRLNALGVNQFAQIAAWKKKDETHYGEVLAFPGRIEREEWVKQAKVLAKGGSTEFAKRVKSGDVSSSIGKADKGDMGTKPKGMLSKARGGKADNLTLIDGVGNAIEKKMFKLGIYHFDQIAKMSKSELVWLGNAVGFPGRPERENWAGESKTLAAGGTTAHAKRVEKGQIKSSRKS
jgi:predicted flap endonuclease-1-like 5' DNA nuclease